MEKNFYGKNIFHYGTGGHHYIGLKNKTLPIPNNILGITLQHEEHNAYIDLLRQDPNLAKNYKVMFADFYTLSENFLPHFDIVNLFHLCEYYVEGMPYHILNDASALNLFISLLNRDGLIFFYKKSSAFSKANKIICRFDNIQKSIDYESIVGYRKL
jgi:hypothetical protein